MDYKLIATKRHEKTQKKFHYRGFLRLFVAIRFFGTCNVSCGLLSMRRERGVGHTFLHFCLLMVIRSSGTPSAWCRTSSDRFVRRTRIMKSKGLLHARGNEQNSPRALCPSSSGFRRRQLQAADTWGNVRAGSSALSAKAVYDSGSSVVSSSANVTHKMR